MNKKIAFLLIIFMVGSWCVFADSSEGSGGSGDGEMAPGVVILIAVGTVLLIGGTIAIILAASGDMEGAQKVMDSLSAEENGSGNANKITNVMNNPIVKHTMVNIIKDNRTFFGFRFAW